MRGGQEVVLLFLMCVQRPSRKKSPLPFHIPGLVTCMGYPKGPRTQILGPYVPNTIEILVVEPQYPIIWILGPLGLGSKPSTKNRSRQLTKPFRLTVSRQRCFEILSAGFFGILRRDWYSRRLVCIPPKLIRYPQLLPVLWALTATSREVSTEL